MLFFSLEKPVFSLGFYRAAGARGIGGVLARQGDDRPHGGAAFGVLRCGACRPLCSWFPIGSTRLFSDDVCHGLAECFMPMKCRCASRNDRARACGSTGLDGKMCTLFALCRHKGPPSPSRSAQQNRRRSAVVSRPARLDLKRAATSLQARLQPRLLQSCLAPFPRRARSQRSRALRVQ